MEPRYEPQGALFAADGSVAWRVWAPLSKKVSLVLGTGAHRREIALSAAPFGYHTCEQTGIGEGTPYTFKLDDGQQYPDPASRWQPEGVHRPSAVFSTAAFAWSDGRWPGIPRENLVFYELHVGTFTPEGTFDAILPRLGELASLGITAIELMPIAQFPGERNWGYDGVHPYAAQNSYGGPRALQRLVDAAHAAGLALFLDVVYNHLGPEGSYFNRFGPYFTDHYHTPWGTAINFGDAYSDPVRQFFIDNAVMWIRDFHVDGLRLDAIHAIYDASALHILSDIRAAVHRAGSEQNRTVHVVAESNLNDVRVVDPPERGGHGLDGAWSDDFHHCVHALLTGERDGYYQDFGEATQLVKALNEVYVYDGCYSPFRRRRHGNNVGSADRTQFVVCLQNHDQIGNRALGDRLTTLLPPAAQRLAAALMLFSPFVPLLFMGEEYGETAPFPFFCSFGDPDLVEAIRKGRNREFADLAFKWQHEIPDAQDPGTFASAKLRWSWPEDSAEAKRRTLYQDLLAARRDWPQLNYGQPLHAELVNTIIVIRRGESPAMMMYANLTAEPATIPSQSASWPSSASSPWFSTEDVRYGGSRTPADSAERLLPYELLVRGATHGD
ncbi:MAG TPA: malto-oligosyltrehalose trehalohydrolase [Pirellulales bacterium]|nr:malto-oligosyltrehalose trehalohydrolase [Pirellulales bacterium]